MSELASDGDLTDLSASPLRRQLLELAEAASGGEPLTGVGDRIELLEQLLGRPLCRRLGIYRLPERFLLSVVIPVYNEEKTLAEVIRRVRATGVPSEIIVINDGSTDQTRSQLEQLEGQPDLVIEHLPHNQGKGAALKRGFARARGDVVLVQDADLEYDPNDYWLLIEPIVAGEADVVFGSRMKGSPQRVLYFWHYLGNRLLTFLSNINTRLNLSDMETCYKVFRRDVIAHIAPTLKESRFGVEPELTAKIAKIPGIRIFERPVAYYGRTYAQGKKISWRDGLRAIWCTLRY